MKYYYCSLLSFFVILNLKTLLAIQPTCRGKHLYEKCVSDEDCEAPYYQCKQGKCTCPLDFEELAIDTDNKSCRPARSTVGSTCISTCKAPLLCQNGKCVCFGGKAVGNQCVITCKSGETLVGQECKRITTSLGGACTKDDDCQIPNSFCNGKVCDCVKNAKKTATACTLTCPDGTQPTKTCKKILVNDAVVAANSEKQDTCTKGYTCATFGKPDIGHCCQLYCPYGSPDITKSCEAGAALGVRCPTFTTHFCQLFEDHGTKNALCCPRPCREPTPMFIKGKCLPKAHWGDNCVEDGQCEGGATMKCKLNKCVCGTGYSQVNTTTFPTCQKSCNLLLQVSVDGDCYSKVNVGDLCLHSAMCPLRSICREGVCQCDCTSALIGGSCINPDDPLNINKFTEVIQGILNPGAPSKTGVD